MRALIAWCAIGLAAGCNFAGPSGASGDGDGDGDVDAGDGDGDVLDAPVGAGTCATGDDRLVFCLSFEAGTADEIGGLVPDASGAMRVAGIDGLAAEFAGQGLHFAEAEAFDHIARLTIEALVSPSPGIDAVIVVRDQYELRVSTTEILCRFTTTSGVETMTASRAGSGEWLHAACQFRADRIRLYENKDRREERDLSYALLSTDGTGLDLGQDGAPMQGRIDNVRIYSEDLPGGDLCPECADLGLDMSGGDGDG